MPDEKQAALPEMDARTFIVIDVCGRARSVTDVCESLMDEISSTLEVLKGVQRNKYPTVAIYQTQVSPAGAQQ